MKSLSVINRQKRIKRFAAVVFAAAFIYVLFTFLYTPFKAEYYISTPDYGNDKLIALTFDDGPSKYTDTLLDGLDEYGARATFFLLGKKVNKRADTVLHMQRGGHLIANHTYYHDTYFKLGAEKFNEELDETDREIEKITGEKTAFFRPPHGFYLGGQLNKTEKIAVLWQYDPADWKNEDADYVCNYIISHAKDGAIILLHDTKRTTVEGALRAIKTLSEQGGYRFVRADELLCRNGEKLKCGVAYRWCKQNRKAFYF